MKDIISGIVIIVSIFAVVYTFVWYPMSTLELRINTALERVAR